MCDKTVEYGCSRRRPDIYIDFGTHLIIIEIDENQHIEYDEICENRRIMEISQDFGHRPIVFIRFNPDSYKNKENKNITSCWSINKLGLCTIKRGKNVEWNERLETLKDKINYWIKNEPTKVVNVEYLYYDNFN